jgi:RpiB/LacA/LacB family sugar-phosphate isomerase
MKIAIGSDHAGFQLKELLAAFLKDKGHEVTDVGCYDEKPCDYPDLAAAVAYEVVSKKSARGIVLCGSGVGASIAANKVKGVRASVCHDTYSAHQGVEHDDMNVLVLGARIIGSELAKEIVTAFVGAHFSNEERHIRRLSKILALEEKFGA